MQKMIADRAFSYRGRALRPGELFDADDEHVALFSKIGHAHVKAEEEASRASQSYQTRVMTAETPRSRKKNAGIPSS